MSSTLSAKRVRVDTSGSQSLVPNVFYNIDLLSILLQFSLLKTIVTKFLVLDTTIKQTIYSSDTIFIVLERKIGFKKQINVPIPSFKNNIHMVHWYLKKMGFYVSGLNNISLKDFVYRYIINFFLFVS